LFSNPFGLMVFKQIKDQRPDFIKNHLTGIANNAIPVR